MSAIIEKIIFNKGLSSIRQIVKLLFVSTGFITLGLGVVGMFVPVLPTTPFLLISSFCFVKGSERFDKWFRSTKIYKKHLEDFVRDRSMTLKQKVSINLLADTMILIAFFMVDKLWVRIILILCILYKWYYFIFKIKTIRRKTGKMTHSRFFCALKH